MLRELAQRRTNFDVADLPAVTTDPWHVDDYCRRLPAEPPGDPVSGGTWEIAKRLMTDYEFADPSMVRAAYDPEAPLLGRDMLLEIRFFAIHVFVGVRVSEIFDEVREVDGRPVKVWGWAYQTLDGHLERGQMDYQLWKWLDTGEIEYRIHAVSELLENVGNPFVRLGFRLVGRREQVLFARRCGDRMERLVRAELERGEEAHPTPDVEDEVAVSPSGRSHAD
jgi:uncharacterized protein (UPF0548 family)